MKKMLGFALCCASAIFSATLHAGHPQGKNQHDRGTDVSEWSSNTVPGPDVFPVGGSGQVNGNFIVNQFSGVQLGLRATERRSPVPLVASFSPSNGLLQTGSYVALTGSDTNTPAAPNRAFWNYDIHLDLRTATGRYAGKTLADYNFYFTTDIADLDLPELGDGEYDLSFGGLIGDGTVLYQQSWNPVFFNDTFTFVVPAEYTFQLVLEPKTFNAPALQVWMTVDVVE